MTLSKNDLPKKISAFYSEKRDLIKGKRLCVCLSGGADSVSLLLASASLSEKFEYELFACHFNHMIRGEEADRDEAFCRQLCKNIGVKLYVGRDDVPAYARYEKISLEEAARILRYKFFERIRERYFLDYTLTAHNMNDDAETLLFNLIRGSGVNGASAIAPENGNILRPMLYVSRDEVEKYLASLGQNYVTDSTNNNSEYTRNYIRNELFPLLKKINPNVVSAFSKYIDSARSDREYFDTVVDQNIDADLRKVHKSVRIRVILRKYKAYNGNLPNSDQIAKLEKAIMSGTRKIISVNDECEAITESGNITFYKSGDKKFAIFKKKKIDLTGTTDIFSGNVTIFTDKDLSFYGGVSETQILNTKFVVGDVYARQKLAGDRICVRGINRSVKKLFNESKIPVEYRNIVPVICDEVGIIYIPFVAVSDRVFSKEINDNSRFVTTVMNTVVRERWKSVHEK